MNIERENPQLHDTPPQPTDVSEGDKLIHDIRSALTAASGYMHLLLARRQDFPGKTFQDLQSVDEAIRAIQTIASRHAARSAADLVAGRPTDVMTVLTQAMRLGHMHAPHGIVMTLLQPASPVTITTNESMLLRALLNLIINGIQAIQPETGSITASCEVVGEIERIPHVTRDAYGLVDQPHVLVSVTDTGRGMTEEQVLLAHHTAFTTKDGGSGLGLCVVRDFIELCGGGLHITSAVGTGSRFSCYLPQRTVISPAPRSASGIHIIPHAPF